MMSTFDDRWRRLVRAARTAKTGEGPIPPPPLFRVAGWAGLARRSSLAAPGNAERPDAELWRWYGRGGLATAGALLVISAWLAFGHAHRDLDRSILQPGIEQVVGEVFWLL